MHWSTKLPVQVTDEPACFSMQFECKLPLQPAVPIKFSHCLIQSANEQLLFFGTHCTGDCRRCNTRHVLRSWSHRWWHRLLHRLWGLLLSMLI